MTFATKLGPTMCTSESQNGVYRGSFLLFFIIPFFNSGKKIYNIKLTILTIYRRTIEWHYSFFFKCVSLIYYVLKKNTDERHYFCLGRLRKATELYGI